MATREETIAQMKKTPEEKVIRDSIFSSIDRIYQLYDEYTSKEGNEEDYDAFLSEHGADITESFDNVYEMYKEAKPDGFLSKNDFYRAIANEFDKVSARAEKKYKNMGIFLKTYLTEQGKSGYEPKEAEPV